MEYLDGKVYVGDFEAGEPNGIGEEVHLGNRLQGEFRNGKCHGQGRMVLKSGRVHTGEWKNGILVKWSKDAPESASSLC